MKTRGPVHRPLTTAPGERPALQQRCLAAGSAVGSWDPPAPQLYPAQDLGQCVWRVHWGVPACPSLAERSQGSSSPDLTTTRLQEIHSKLRFEFQIHKSFFRISSSQTLHGTCLHKKSPFIYFAKLCLSIGKKYLGHSYTER